MCAPQDLHSSAFQIKAIVFFSPDERPMSVTQALGKGYGVTNGPTRLVVRGSPTAPEAYQQDVSEPDSLVWTGVYNDTGVALYVDSRVMPSDKHDQLLSRSRQWDVFNNPTIIGLL